MVFKFKFQLLEKGLEEFGHDLDFAIKYLNELRLGYVEGKLCSAVEAHANMKNGVYAYVA